MLRANRRGSDAIVRWDVEPLDRSRRGLDERLLLAMPWLASALSSAAVRARPGSRPRRALGHVICAGMEANNRRDYEVVAALLGPDVELHLIPDAPEVRAADMEPVYFGREGYIEASEL